jgi:hypothetical protein
MERKKEEGGGRTVVGVICGQSLRTNDVAEHLRRQVF